MEYPRAVDHLLGGDPHGRDEFTLKGSAGGGVPTFRKLDLRALLKDTEPGQNVEKDVAVVEITPGG
jgi:hypothetical protein